MFNFFKKKEEKPKPVPVDLNITSMNLSNKLNETSLKVNAIDKELKAQLQIYRNERNPTRKAQAKKKATQLLKKKKMYEQHINNLSNTQMTVDSANMDCQIMKDNMNIMQVMKDTVQVQKDTVHAMGGVDSMYDIAEIKDEQQELNEEFQRNYDVDVGDEELDAELDDLNYQMRMEMDNDGLKAPGDQVGGEQVKNSDEVELEDALK